VSAHHELKTWPIVFQAVWTRRKSFEIRLNDRGYQAGDTVTLREFDPKGSGCECPQGGANVHVTDCAKYSGRSVTARVGYVLANFPGRGGQRGFNGGEYVVFSLLEPENHGTQRPVVAQQDVATPKDLARLVSTGLADRARLTGERL
jgi:hypothetical protein